MGRVETEIIAFHFRAYTHFILKLVKEGYFLFTMAFTKITQNILNNVFIRIYAFDKNSHSSY